MGSVACGTSAAPTLQVLLLGDVRDRVLCYRVFLALRYFCIFAGTS